MILIGMLDSPFVRRVAVSATRLGIAFEHRSWSVGKDAEAIRAYSPQARVPALVLDDGEVLIESYTLLDYLDDLVGPEFSQELRLGGRGDRNHLRALQPANLYREMSDAAGGAVFGRAEIVRDQETALAVQLLLVGREKHALPNRALRPAPESPLMTPRAGRQPLLMRLWDSMGSEGPQWD